ncbi:hypothetical protein D910_09386, partial [Dendroctonus ponderosae]
MLVYVIVSLILVAASLLVRCHRKWLYRVIKTLPRDAKNLHVIFKLSSKLKHWSKQEDTVPTIFTKLAKEHPDKTALIIDGRRWSYQELETFSNRVANFFKSQGYKKGDVVALLMENRPEYLGLWLGLAKIGVVTSLINSHLLSTPLTHSILASHNKGLIYGSDFRQVVEDIKEQIQQVVLYEFGGDGDATDLKKQLEASPSSLPEEVFGLRQQDLLFYMYTSGTTGLPKPAKIPHTRFILIATTMNFALDLSPSDVLYSPLPLYHASAGVFSAGQALLFGITFVGRKKFSASNFWTDCQQYKCTVANYIGEVCRYLLAAHKPGTTVQHNVMKMCGNGLRPQIWQQFKDTFSIGQIYEFYGSTEGNAFLISMDGKLGAVGSVPLWGNWLVSTVLIQCNENTGEPIRNRQGLYSRCKRGEPGLLVGRIVQQGYKSFQGYLDSSATEQKVLRDVLVKGDAYFNTGDILVEDEYGYLYFKDRTGDTFRWKGENVATNEVEAIVSEAIGLKDCMVIGVQVPNTEGRAGMAIIESSEDTIGVQSLAKVLKSKLPSYAIPLFLRTVPTLPKTATQKYKKLEFEKQGFNVTKIPDTSVFVLDLKSLDYVPLTRDMYDDIMLGFIAGVANKDKLYPLERLLWRISRGNILLRQADIDELIEDPITGVETRKAAFIVFFQGENLATKILKICSGFKITIVNVPADAALRDGLVKGVAAEVLDLKMVISQTEDHRRRILVSVAKEIQSWIIIVYKMKAIYNTLNMFSQDISRKCLIAEGWVPKKDLVFVARALSEGFDSGGSSVASFYNVLDTQTTPPTFNRTNRFTQGFQNLIASYAFSSYRELNPALYTIITFPFLFAIMFGDLGHGVIVTCFGIWMVLSEKKIAAQKGKNEIFSIFFGGRYIILLMGIFSMYTGFIYNDVFSKSMNIFGTKWKVNSTNLKQSGISFFEDNDTLVSLVPLYSYAGSPYFAGLDPAWQ